MSEKKNLPLIAAGSIVLGSMALVSGASEARAADFQSLGTGSQLRSNLLHLNSATVVNADEKEGTEGKCGENTCGGAEDDKDGGEGKCGEGKCGEGKCGTGE